MSDGPPLDSPPDDSPPDDAIDWDDGDEQTRRLEPLDASALPPDVSDEASVGDDQPTVPGSIMTPEGADAPPVPLAAPPAAVEPVTVASAKLAAAAAAAGVIGIEGGDEPFDGAKTILREPRPRPRSVLPPSVGSSGTGGSAGTGPPGIPRLGSVTIPMAGTPKAERSASALMEQLKGASQRHSSSPLRPKRAVVTIPSDDASTPAPAAAAPKKTDKKKKGDLKSTQLSAESDAQPSAPLTTVAIVDAPGIALPRPSSPPAARSVSPSVPPSPSVPSLSVPPQRAVTISRPPGRLKSKPPPPMDPVDSDPVDSDPADSDPAEADSDPAEVDSAADSADVQLPSVDPPTLDPPPGERVSEPGVVADSASIFMMRPVMVENDLPPISSRTLMTEDIEEIDSLADENELDTAEDISDVVEPQLPPPRKATDPPGAIAAEDAARQGLPPPSKLPGGQALPPPSNVPTGNLASTAPMSQGPATEQSPTAASHAVAADAKAAAKAKAPKPPGRDNKKQPWWMEMFGARMSQTLDNPQRDDVRKETDFILKGLKMDPGSRILDMACGTGVHAVEVAARGFQVVGVDSSETMLNLARAYNTQREQSVSFIQGDMRQLNLEGVFDGLYCWSSSFGYFDEKHNRMVLDRMARALRPGGRMILDLTNRDYVAPRAPSMAWFRQGTGCTCMDEMRFDFSSSRMFVKRMVLFENGGSKELEFSLRLYTLTEMGTALQSLGLKVLEVSGHRAHRGAYFGAESERMIILAEKSEDSIPPGPLSGRV